MFLPMVLGGVGYLLYRRRQDRQQEEQRKNSSLEMARSSKGKKSDGKGKKKPTKDKQKKKVIKSQDSQINIGQMAHVKKHDSRMSATTMTSRVSHQ
ncbi:hypothetical protein LSAT2_005216 [Lamellibrachia satsuma]|nr:hypothetical protein LSAT2_005216 [Lamellibrachia satsuma]